jgi:serine/threonine protein kinase
MLEVAEGVQYMHSEGVVHGDLKGVHIMILQIDNQFISSARKISSSTLISTAELLILDSHDILTPLPLETVGKAAAQDIGLSE